MSFSGLHNLLRLCPLAMAFGLPYFAQAQQPVCGFDKHFHDRIQNDPGFLARFEAMDNEVMKERSRSKNGDEELIIIPVVVHVFHQYGSENITKAQIEAQLQTLNDSWNKRNADSIYISNNFMGLRANMRVEFRLAKKDPNGNCTDGMTRTYTALTVDGDDEVKDLIRWDTERYLNIWVVKSIHSDDPNKVILGYAQFPQMGSANTDGITIRADQMVKNNTTLTHEAGHYFGLFHTFESAFGNDCGNPSRCSYSGDRVCDTPPTDGNASRGCNLAQNTCTGGSNDLPDMIENFMDYSECGRMFSLGQSERVRNYLYQRSTLWSQANIKAAGVDGSATAAYCRPKADFYLTQNVVCAGSTIRFFDNTTNGVPTQYRWVCTSTSGEVVTSSHPEGNVSMTEAGKVTVKLVVSNPAGADSVVKTSVFTVLPSEAVSTAPVVEDFENFNWGTTGWQKGGSSTLEWQTTTSGASSGSKSIYLASNNAVLGTTAQFTLPGIDMTSSVVDKLSFRVAHARRSNISADNLAIYGSTDCGKTFTLLTRYQWTHLQTVQNYVTGFFVPTADQWKTLSYNIYEPYKSSKNLILRFEYTSQNGNNIYLDDINIGTYAVSIGNEQQPDVSFDLYPNPARDQVTLELDIAQSQAVLMTISDVSGKVVTQKAMGTLPSGQFRQTYSLEQLNIAAPGVYIVQLQTPEGSLQRKLLIAP